VINKSNIQSKTPPRVTLTRDNMNFHCSENLNSYYVRYYYASILKCTSVMALSSIISTDKVHGTWFLNNKSTINWAPRAVRSRDSSVGIATCYGLDGPGSIPASAKLFSTASRPTLGLTQPPLCKCAPGALHSPASSAKVKKGGATPPLPHVFTT
jgi:hypothetical protein